MKIRLDTHSLPVQMIVSFILVSLLTAAAVGLPAIWLIREQLDRQAWSQLEQGQGAALALYSAKQVEIENLAQLFAQRPTLQELWQTQNWAALETYLRTLMTGAGLDLVVVCPTDDAQPGTAPAQASTEVSLPADVCETWANSGYQVIVAERQPQVWLTASKPVETQNGSGAIVRIGMRLDNTFTRELEQKTGVDHTIWILGVPVASSFQNEIEGIAQIHQAQADPGSSTGTQPSTFSLDGKPYYAVLDPLTSQDIQTQAALGVQEITATQNSLVGIMAGAILFVTLVVSLLGVYLSRRISKPLVQLAQTAETFRGGDLSTPIIVDARIREVAQVSQALEDTRIDLQDTLTNLAREKAWVDHLLESIVEGILTLNAEGRVTYFSQGAVRITGWQVGEVIGRSCDEVFVLPEMDTTFSESIRETGARKKLLVTLKDGHRATLAFTRSRLAPTEAGDAQSVLVFRDVSEGELIHRILGNFLANIAHEFRTPLSSAEASVELLIDQAPDLSDSELQELLTTLHLGIIGLGSLVDNLLECASIEAGRFRVSPRANDLSVIISRAVQTLSPLLEKYGQHLRVELPAGIPLVNADSRRVEQVLVNLISNASKFGPPDEEIMIRVLVEGDWANVQVSDRGPGIEHEQREYVFRRMMHPGMSDERARAGAGLGLMVVKAVIDAHAGPGRVDDRPGGGSTFWFTLPVIGEL